MLTAISFFNLHNAVADVTIGEDETVNTSSLENGDSVVFNGTNSGTLKHNSTREIHLLSVTTDRDGVGLINMDSSSASVIRFVDDIGSATNRIDRIFFTTQLIANINNSFYAKTGIETALDGRGSITLDGDNSLVIFDHLGASNLRLGNIAVGGNNVSLSGNIFATSFFVVSLSKATISDLAANNYLGDVRMEATSELSLNSDAKIGSLFTASQSVINIAAGKQINIIPSDSVITNSNLTGTLNLNIDRSDSTKASILVGAGTLAIIAETVDLQIVPYNINFNYANASYLKVGDSYDFIKSTSGAITVDINQLHFTDNSILLEPTVVLNGGNRLTLTTALDTNTTGKLDEKELATTTFIVSNQTAQDIDLVRTSLLKISTQTELEEALKTFQIPQNNMLQLTSLGISNQIDNVIAYHTQSSSYENLASVYKLTRKPLYEAPYKIKSKKKIKTQTEKSLWGEVFGGSSQQTTIDNQAGFSNQSAGIIFGLDHVIKDNRSNQILGGAFSYASSKVSDKSATHQDATVNTYQLSLYSNIIGKTGAGLFNDNLASFGYNQYNTNRSIKVGSYRSTTKGNFAGNTYSAKTAVGYNFKISQGVFLAPVASLKYFGLAIDNYQEQDGGGFGLDVKNNFFQTLTSDFGARIVGQFTPEIYFKFTSSWSRNLKNEGGKIITTFSDGTGQLRVNNVDIEKSFMNFGSEINFKTDEDSSMTLQYQLQSGQSLKSQFAGIRYNFKF
ncbi:MAG: autotransporter outer membrane beta-barrel domain-containing protein [Pseudomonadota bacterium]